MDNEMVLYPSEIQILDGIFYNDWPITAAVLKVVGMRICVRLTFFGPEKSTIPAPILQDHTT